MQSMKLILNCRLINMWECLQQDYRDHDSFKVSEFKQLMK